MQGFILPQVQNIVSFLTELPELHVGLLPRFIPLDLGSPTWQVSCSPLIKCHQQVCGRHTVTSTA